MEKFDRLLTGQLLYLYKDLVKLKEKDMTASGIRIQMYHLDSTYIGDMEFMGELLPELIPILLKSLETTLRHRLVAMKAELNQIEKFPFEDQKGT